MRGRLDADVIVVGAGIAGAATAIALGRRGRSVLLLDRAGFPRDKPCGEGLMPNGVDVLAKLGVLSDLRPDQARSIDGVRYSLASGESAAAEFPAMARGSSHALGIRRLVLDQALLERAAATPGVHVLTRCRVHDIRFESDCVQVRAGDTVFRSRTVAGADGLHSAVRTMLGWGARRPWLRYGVVGHFGGGQAMPPRIEVMLSGTMEAYVTPLPSDEALVALLGGRGLMRRMAGDLSGGYERCVRRLPALPESVRAGRLQGRVLATGPFAVRSSRVAGQGALLVGDAAGFLDPITGEGMAAALEQALAAAAVIDAGLARGGGLPDLSPYTELRRRIVRSPNLLTLLALGLCVSPPLRRRATRALAERPGLFARLLAVNSRRSGLGCVSPRDWAALLTGR